MSTPSPVKPGRGPGRPPKLTPELTEKICAELRRGVPKRAAAIIVRIRPETFTRWMTLGEQDPDSRHGVFRMAVLEAEATIYRLMAAKYASLVAKSDDPDDVQKWLKSVNPEEWSEQRVTRKVETTGANGGPIEQRVTMAESVALTLVQEALSVPGMEAARQAIAEKFAKAAQAPVVVDPEDEDSDEE